MYRAAISLLHVGNTTFFFSRRLHLLYLNDVHSSTGEQSCSSSRHIWHCE